MAVWGRAEEFSCIERLLGGCSHMAFLEFGCVRGRDTAHGDGHSTVFLADFAKRTNSKVVSCDISEAAIATAKDVLTSQGLSDYVTFVCRDAREFARDWPPDVRIDVLLLDGCAAWPTTDAEAFEEAHLDVFLSLENRLGPLSVVGVDDVTVRGGKVIPFMESSGWKNNTPGANMAVLSRP